MGGQSILRHNFLAPHHVAVNKAADLLYFFRTGIDTFMYEVLIVEWVGIDEVVERRAGEIMDRSYSSASIAMRDKQIRRA